MYIENGLHKGKIIIIFEVLDRPLISKTIYEGVDQTQQAEILEALKAQKMELSDGAEYDLVKVRRAAKIIKDLLISKGHQGAKVEGFVEQQTSIDVLVNFKIEIEN